MTSDARGLGPVRPGAILGVALSIWAACPPAWSAPRAASLVLVFGPASEVRYQVDHPMHSSVGVSHELVGKVTLEDAAQGRLDLPLTLSIPIRSFDSGNRNRDRNMWKITHVESHPDVTLEVRSVNWSRKSAEGDGFHYEGTAQAVLSLNGHSSNLTVPLAGDLSGTTLKVSSTFTFKLSDHEVERPSMLFRAIDDDVKMTVAGVAEAARP